jgi:hypothetical protein
VEVTGGKNRRVSTSSHCDYKLGLGSQTVRLSRMSSPLLSLGLLIHTCSCDAIGRSTLPRLTAAEAGRLQTGLFELVPVETGMLPNSLLRAIAPRSVWFPPEQVTEVVNLASSALLPPSQPISARRQDLCALLQVQEPRVASRAFFVEADVRRLVPTRNLYRAKILSLRSRRQ